MQLEAPLPADAASGAAASGGPRILEGAWGGSASRSCARIGASSRALRGFLRWLRSLRARKRGELEATAELESRAAVGRSDS